MWCLLLVIAVQNDFIINLFKVTSSTSGIVYTPSVTWSSCSAWAIFWVYCVFHPVSFWIPDCLWPTHQLLQMGLILSNSYIFAWNSSLNIHWHLLECFSEFFFLFFSFVYYSIHWPFLYMNRFGKNNTLEVMFW